MDDIAKGKFLIGEGRKLLKGKQKVKYGEVVNIKEYTKWRAQCLQYLRYSDREVYSNEFDALVTRNDDSSTANKTLRGIGVIEAIVEDLEQGMVV